MKKEVSFIVRNHNNSATLFRTLSSIFAQNLAQDSYEVILVDDQSTDGSLQKLGRSLLQKVTLVRARGEGATHALNTGIQHATGRWFFIVDADDFLPPTAVKKMLFMAKHHRSAAIVYGDYIECTERSPFSCYWKLNHNIYHTIAGGLLIKKSVAKKYHYYDQSLFFPEYDLLKKISSNHMIVYLPEVVYYYFRHRKSLTSQGNRAMRGIEQLQKKYNEALPIRAYDW